MFTSSEYFYILVLYGQCNESATVAAQDYAVRFPHDLLDSQSVYSGLGVDRKILCSHDSDV
jgi:hypothetical protein